MNKGSKFLIDEVIENTIKLAGTILDNEDRVKLINQANSTKKYLESMSKIGDTYVFLLKSIESAKKKKNDNLLEKYNMKGFESVLDDFKNKFSKDLYNISNLNDLREGSIYTRTEITSYTHNDPKMKGMVMSLDGLSLIMNKRVENGVVLYANTHSDQDYSNAWIEEGYRLKYYLERRKSDPPKLTYEANLATVNNEYPLYVLENAFEKGKYVYHGKFYCEKFVDGDYVILKKISVTQPKNEIDIINNINEPNSIYGLGKKANLIKTYTKVSLEYERDRQIVIAAKERSKGICEICGENAPFYTRNGNEPYLEVHHIIPLSKGGDDTLENVVAICPNCHRKEHFG